MGPEEALWDSKAAFVSLVSERKCETQLQQVSWYARQEELGLKIKGDL